MGKLVNIEVDKLTNSIINRITGDCFDTQIVELVLEDCKFLKVNWNFDWETEFNNPETKVFKLVVGNNLDVIQGLISLIYKEGFVFVELVENSDFNIGRNKVYLGVAGNLFAFACKVSWDQGNFGYVAFNSKTNLIPHYEQTLGAKRIGYTNQMVIEPKQAIALINKYYNE